MSKSSKKLNQILGPKGSLSRLLDGFEFRQSQLQMARLIDQGLAERRHVLIEAGTGTGKTLGYLVPLVLSGKKAVVSTGTKNLQDQIYFKDIPLLSRAFDHKLDVVLMKGRRNYLCLHRYHQAFAEPGLFDQSLLKLRARMDRWIERTRFADRSELDWLSDKDPLWDTVSCPSDQCLGGKCLHFDRCFLNVLRRRAARAQIVIVNHHLFFADLMVKQGGFGEILPRFEVVVMDEAHTVESTATNYFGERLSTNQLTELATDTEKALRVSQDEGEPVKKSLEQALHGVRAAADKMREMLQNRDERGLLDNETKEALKKGPASMLREELRRVLKSCDLDSIKDPVLQAFPLRAGELSHALAVILESEDPNLLTWYERRKRGVVLHASPLDVSGPLREHLFEGVDSTVLTSATLSTSHDFSYVRSRLGLEGDCIEGLFTSHFDFMNRTLLYIPRDLPLPAAPEFPDRAADRILDILKASSGRALVLFTSYHNLNRVHDRLSSGLPYTLFRQGEAPRPVLLERFRKDVHSVLLATGSFWQGVDVPGETLSCVIIDKLPFESPGDPLVAARIEAIRKKGKNPFMDYQVPSAIIALKQGLGRLIRKSTDRGILAVLDKRLVASRYGKQFLQSLPAMPVRHDLEALTAFFSPAPEDAGKG